MLWRAESLASELLTLGGANSIIALQFTNSASVFEAFIAGELLGATRVPIDPHAAPDEAIRIAVAAGAKLIMTNIPALKSRCDALGSHESGRTRSSASAPTAVYFDDCTPLPNPPWRGSFEIEPERVLVC